MNTYYEILGISRDASMEEIKKAFRKLSLKYHPDKCNDQDSNSKFQRINEAYETLYDIEKRKIYDLNQRISPKSYQENVNISNLFENLFNMNLNKQSSDSNIFSNDHIVNQLQKPAPLIETIIINFEQTYFKQTIPLEIERSIVEEKGKVKEKERIYVDIEEGIDENEMIILRNKGNINHLGVQGDIKVFVKINNKTEFKRNGLNIEISKDINLKNALCGFSFTIDHINGKNYKLNNEKGNIIFPHFVKTIPKLGFKRGNQIGNMCVRFNVIFPKSIDKEKIEKLKELLPD